MTEAPKNLHIAAATTLGLLVVGAMAAVALSQAPKASELQNFRDDGGDVLKSFSVSQDSDEGSAELKLDGVPVPLNQPGTTHIKKDGAEATVTVSEDGDTGASNSSNTSVNISVDSHSTEGKTSSKTRIRSSEGSTRTTSSTEINIQGEGQINQP